MKKYLLLFFGLFVIFSSCEKDDICIDPITPNLIIRFVDFENQDELKSVTSLSVWANGKELIYNGTTTDSIAIPLDINEDFTLYKMAQSDVEDDVNFTYNRKDVYVGRSCGYKTVFESLDVSSHTSNWIKQIEIVNNNVENETSAKVLIYH